MEPHSHRVANCGWCMVGWYRIEHMAYVSDPLLFTPLSHVPYLRLQRSDNGEELYRVLVLDKNEPAFMQNSQAFWDV